MDRESLLGAGMVGLIQAVDHFDAEKGVAFETYARIRIKGAVQDELRHMDYLTRDQRRVAKSVSETKEQLTKELGREANDVEVAAEIDMSVDEVQTAIIHNNAPQALDPTILDETVIDGAWEEQEDTETKVARKQAVERVQAELEKLPERERMVMSLYYEQSLNLAEIGNILDVSQSRVSQIITKTKALLKKRLKRQLDY